MLDVAYLEAVAAATRLQTEVPRAIPPDNARKTVPGLNRNL